MTGICSVYFAHPVSDYGSTWQAKALMAIRACQDFEGWDITNPDRPEFEAGYRAHGMQFFIERCDECDAVVAAPFPDGNYGAGVGKEFFSFVMRRRPVYLINRETLAIAPGIAGPVLSVEMTRKWVGHYTPGQTQKNEARPSP